MSVDPSEAIVRAAETALDVRRRYQFFVWSQSHLHPLLPHQLAVCGAYERGARELLFDVFNSVSVDTDLLSSLHAHNDALMQRLQGAWLDANCKPVVVTTASLSGQVLQAQRDALIGGGFATLLLHGVSRPSRPREIESFFMFACQGSGPSAVQCSQLEVLMPHIHSAWQRVQAFEREVADSPQPAQRSDSKFSGVTLREKEVLGWLREGMSNQQISEVLGISALTVKNHVQKILRKLNAANRAQAVARAMSLQLLDRMNVELASPRRSPPTVRGDENAES